MVVLVAAGLAEALVVGCGAGTVGAWLEGARSQPTIAASTAAEAMNIVNFWFIYVLKLAARQGLKPKPLTHANRR